MKNARRAGDWAVRRRAGVGRARESAGGNGREWGGRGRARVGTGERGAGGRERGGRAGAPTPPSGSFLARHRLAQ